VDPNNLRSRRLGVTGKRAFWGSISKLTSASSARTSRKYKSKSNSGKVRVGATIVLAIVAGALFSGLTVVFPVGLLRHTMGLSPAAAALNTPTWGEVLIAGGGAALTSTDLYDPTTNSFAAAGDTATMNTDRYGATATLLASGQVLIAGGANGESADFSSTELYDPTTNSFAAPGNTATMNIGRYAMTATLLPSGKVLIAGGLASGTYPTSTELYDPTTNTFAAPANTAAMNTGRAFGATATLLPSGKVLIAGGYNDGSALSSTELYDPPTNSFAAPGNTAVMNVARYGTNATLLPSGKVLIAGGQDSSGNPLSSTELYDPATNTFAAPGSTATMNTARYDAPATLLGSGKVLIAGGGYSPSNALSSTELYDPATNTFAAAGNTATMNAGRDGSTATLLPSGEVLITGGVDSSNNGLSSTELYNPTTNRFAAAANTPTMNAIRYSDTATLLLPPCTVTYTGTFTGNLTISSGLTCIVGCTVTGNVTESGGGLFTSNATIGGNLQITSGGTFSLASTVVDGDVQIQNIPAGSAQNQICGTNVKGILTFHNNGTAVAIGTTSTSCPGNTIGSDLQINNNTAAVQVSDDTVGGNLQCGGNSSIMGSGDTAKSLQGQCAGF
jgi:Galactose oxidase, central domain/Kelch motif